MFTPKELKEKTFDKAVFGGYDMQMVDEFLEPLTEDYITLYKENSVLKNKMKILVEKLEEYREQELSMKKALVAAQQTADTIVADAQKRASKILNDAESTAQNRVASVKAEFAEEEDRVARARAAALSFVDAIEADVERHLSILDRLKRVSAQTAAPAPAPAEKPAEKSFAAPKAEPAAEEAAPAAEEAAPVAEEVMPAAEEVKPAAQEEKPAFTVSVDDALALEIGNAVQSISDGKSDSSVFNFDSFKF